MDSPHLIGILIIALSVVLSGALVWYRWHTRLRPDEWHRGVGVIYRPGTERPWEGRRALIDSILDQQQHEEDFALRRLPGWGSFWIEVFAYTEPITNDEVLTGWLWASGPKAGYSCSPPMNEAEAAERVIVAGSLRWYRALPFMRRTCVLQVRQLRDGGTAIEHRLLRGTGSTKSAGWSAAHHEHAEHYVSWLRYRDRNTAHARADLRALKTRMRERYNAIVSGSTK